MPRRKSKSPVKRRSMTRKSRSRKTASRKGKVSYRHQGTKGWKSASPRRGNPRKRMSAKCTKAGVKDCFLLPKERKFPIRNPKTLALDCRALKAAHVRAGQYPQYHYLLPRIEKLLAESEC